MRLDSFRIQNFAAIENASATALRNLVVVAGPNGCGKSCLFDAIRILKAYFGEYQFNELISVFSEKNIGLQKNRSELEKLFRDASKPVSIEARFVLSSGEKKFIDANLEVLLRDYIWRSQLRPHAERAQYVIPSTALERKDLRERTAAALATEGPKIRKELARRNHLAAVRINPDKSEEFVENSLLTVVLSAYQPPHIGVMQYYGAHRNFGYERLGNLNLNNDAWDDKMRAHAIVGYSNKFSHIKLEMATGLIRSILAKAAGGESESDDALADSLIDLFATFFPHKTFVGPAATKDGSVEFCVRLRDGKLHDIDDLSAGEKEVLFGYLRLRKSAPQNSVIMLDEPEIHLNPRLIRGLPGFFQKHIGMAMNNQLLLVTHSDTLLRECLHLEHATLLHMEDAAVLRSTTQQLKKIEADDDVERAVFALVGDLPSYRPHATVVLCEGENSRFDEWMISQLFEEHAAQVNVVSTGDKRLVGKLHDVLDRAREAGAIDARFFSIVDSDVDGTSQRAAHVNRLSWDRYHIENYLLDAEAIAATLAKYSGSDYKQYDSKYVSQELKKSATNVYRQLVRGTLETNVNRRIVGAIRTNIDRSATNSAGPIFSACKESLARIKEMLSKQLSLSELKREEDALVAEIKSSLSNGTWVKTIPGRDVLRDFRHRHVSGMNYDVFRDQIVSQMREMRIQPQGMKDVLDRVVSGKSVREAGRGRNSSRPRRKKSKSTPRAAKKRR